jgi:transposase
MISKTALSGFFPEYVEITNVVESPSEILIKMETKTMSATCPDCGMESTNRNCGYTRAKMQDLPILGNKVFLQIYAQMFSCMNPACKVSTFTENLPGLAGSYRQWTMRCEALIMAIAVNTSCEAASRICKEMNIGICGDTIIRMLLRNVREMPFYGEAIGVDDFALKKGQNYGTMICDLESHRPLALLPGRDGQSLKEWLARNKQVKLVTRDRAGSYAAAINEVLPNAVQVADRFHLYQNLLLAVKEALNGIIPDRIWIADESAVPSADTVKKTNSEGNQGTGK